MTDYTALSNEELSVEIARRLFGKVPCGPNCTLAAVIHPPPYASDHNAAMGLVVPEMRRLGYIFECGLDGRGVAWARFIHRNSFVRGYAEDGDRPPRAICEVALKALEA